MGVSQQVSGSIRLRQTGKKSRWEHSTSGPPLLSAHRVDRSRRTTNNCQVHSPIQSTEIPRARINTYSFSGGILWKIRPPPPLPPPAPRNTNPENSRYPIISTPETKKRCPTNCTNVGYCFGLAGRGRLVDVGSELPCYIDDLNEACLRLPPPSAVTLSPNATYYLPIAAYCPSHEGITVVSPDPTITKNTIAQVMKDLVVI